MSKAERKTVAPKNTFWRGNTLFGRVKVKGRLIRWSLQTGDPKIARQRVKAGKARAIAAIKFGDDRKTWEETVIEWTDFIEREVSPTTAARYASSLEQIEPWLRGKHHDEIDKQLVLNIISGRRKVVSNATIKRDLGALSSVLGYAEDHNFRDDNPALARLKRIKERRDPIILPSDEDIRTVIGECPGNLKKMVRAALNTGCRQSELSNAKPIQVNHKTRQFTVIGKGRKMRVLNLSKSAMMDFKEDTYEWLFWHHKGKPYKNVASYFAKIVKLANVRKFRFHDLRHVYAVKYLKAGGSIYDLQQILGHSSITTTEMYLKYLTPDEIRVSQKVSQAAKQTKAIAT